MLTLQQALHDLATKLWSKAKDRFISRDESINGVILDPMWDILSTVNNNTTITLPALDSFDEIYIVMDNGNSTVIHQTAIKKESLLSDNENVTYREILLDTLYDAETYVTYYPDSNTIVPSICEGVSIDESSDITTTIYTKKYSIVDGTKLGANIVSFDDSATNLGATNVQGALENVLSKANTYTDTKVADLVDSAPDTLDTIGEIAQALKENDDVITVLNNAIGEKANQSDLDSLNNTVKNTLGYTAGKNLLENTATTTTINGITFTVNDDGSVTVNGTATAITAFRFAKGIVLPNGEYILNGCPNGSSVNTYYLYMTGTGIAGHDAGAGKTFVIEDNVISGISIFVIEGQTVNNVTFYPMIRKADVTDDTYEPYSGIDVDTRLRTLEKNKITSGTTDLTAGTSALASGTIYCVYE